MLKWRGRVGKRHPNHQGWHAKAEAQLEYVHDASTSFARLMPICKLSRCLSTTFLHRSSVGSLLRVPCWLGWVAFKGDQKDRNGNRSEWISPTLHNAKEGAAHSIQKQQQRFSPEPHEVMIHDAPPFLPRSSMRTEHVCVCVCVRLQLCFLLLLLPPQH